MVASPAGSDLYVACAAVHQIRVVSANTGTVTGLIALPGSPSGLAISADGRQLWVTCAGPRSLICLIDTVREAVVDTYPAGHTATAPVLSPDGALLAVCHRFNHEVALFDVARRRMIARIPVAREPVAAAITPNGQRLLVANHLHNGRADADVAAAVISVIDLPNRRVMGELSLPHGSGLLLGVAVSPDGRHAAVTHNLGRPNLPTTQVDRGWMNTSALTLIDVKDLRLINTVLLDSVDRGAANPWAVAWATDGQRLYVTHAGTHELSVINAPALLDKLDKMPLSLAPGYTPDYTRASNIAADVPNDLAFLVDLRQRVRLAGQGARSLVVLGKQAWVGQYFSDTLNRVDFTGPVPQVSSVALGKAPSHSSVRRGEMLFNDASICFQQWQSCASCHSFDGRIDALNWDLLNDGLGNPKNNRSLLLSHRTPPSMSQGVRETAEQAVRAGIRHILFTVQPEDVALALDDYLKALQPVPSPYLVRGQLSAAARRGKELFFDAQVGCATCHPEGLFTDLEHYDVGTRGRFDASDEFDTPTLIELWRTGPYLHDGSAVTLHEVLTSRNAEDQHGRTSHLSQRQIDALVAYLLSL
jgi:DNA-binding beta-propeller fold protein YncE/cytochrome c peroxidase